MKKVRETQISYDITYMWNLKYDTNELIYKQKQTHKHTNKLMVTKEKRSGDKLGLLYQQSETTIYKVDKQ